MSDLDGRYRLARERIDILRAEAARERLVREVRAGGNDGRARRERPSQRVGLGMLFIRVGRALGGEGRGTAASLARATVRGSLEEAGS